MSRGTAEEGGEDRMGESLLKVSKPTGATRDQASRSAVESKDLSFMTCTRRRVDWIKLCTISQANRIKFVSTNDAKAGSMPAHLSQNYTKIEEQEMGVSWNRTRCPELDSASEQWLPDLNGIGSEDLFQQGIVIRVRRGEVGYGELAVGLVALEGDDFIGERVVGAREDVKQVAHGQKRST
ncbi:MAG: hypothetical protein JWR19_3100 [Pedosphaera sp.]|nr:hypothetical protein [Pedosphaera sp.]